MIAMLGLESIGDDADWRTRQRRAGQERMTLRRAPTREWARLLHEERRYEERPRAWVARLVGRDAKFGYAREFLRAQRDYAEANSTGSRGVMKWYTLDEGPVYEVSEPISWSHGRRYFCRAERGKVVEITKEDVERWLDAQGAESDRGAGI